MGSHKHPFFSLSARFFYAFFNPFLLKSKQISFMVMGETTKPNPSIETVIEIMDVSFFNFVFWKTDLKVRKLLGRSCLHEYRLDDALKIYQSILRDYPDDEDVLLILGELYRLSGDLHAAKCLYGMVHKQNPFNVLAIKQLNQAGDTPVSGLNMENYISAEALVRLAAHLQEKYREENQDTVRNVADIVEKMLAENGFRQNLPVKGNLEQLMPALVDMNLRQARASGQHEMAEALQSLRMHWARQSGDIDIEEADIDQAISYQEEA